MKTMLRTASLIALASAALSAHATLIDFEHLSGGTDDGGFTRYDSPLTTQGFVFTTSAEGFTSNDPGNLNYTGSTAIAPFGVTPFTLTRAGGGAFALLSLDVANYYLQSAIPGGGSVTFTGTLVGGGTVTQTYLIPADDALHTVSLVGFGDVTSVSVDDTVFRSEQYGQYDNFNVADPINPATPGPIAALPFALMALRRRKRA